MKGMSRVNKKSDIGLYIGMILVLLGIVFFLDLNMVLPSNSLSQLFNILVGVVLVVISLKKKKLSILMVGAFFFINGGILIIDQLLPGYNYLCAGLLIPGLMLMVAYSVRRYSALLVPGAVLTSLGIYLLLITAKVIWGFSWVLGMFFIFVAIGFLIIYICEQKIWAIITSSILGVLGVVIVTLGIGPVMRHWVFNSIAIGAVVVGGILILRNLLGDKSENN